MKVSLVVASGVHQGKSIPVNGPKFIIGRDETCQLRPASQAVSKQHCGIFLKDSKVFIVDYGSTNGTSVNDQQLTANTETELKHGDRIKAGPLDLTLNLALPKPSDSTPLPAALKPISSSAVKKLAEATGKPPAPKAPAAKRESDDDIAAMLLGMGEDDAPRVPEGSTIMEMPAGMAGAPEKPDEKKSAIPSQETSSSAASDLLRKYMRRPR
jgi:predicted component of type VI protein secretion system